MAIVYQHRRNDTGEVFYVGIGDSIIRAYQKASRNRYWKNIVRKFGYSVEIIYENIPWEDACIKEQELIKYYGRKDLGEGILVNRTDGGEGAKRLVHSEDYRNRLRIYGPMSNEDTVRKWKNTMNKRTEQEKSRTADKIIDAVFNKYSKEEINARYKKMGEKMKGVKRPHTSETMKGKEKQKVQCEKCGIMMSKNHMTRYHINKCKNANDKQ